MVSRKTVSFDDDVYKYIQQFRGVEMMKGNVMTFTEVVNLLLRSIYIEIERERVNTHTKRKENHE